MKLSIKHISKYKFSKNLSYGVQRLRLKPQNNKIQNINRWNINIQGGVEQFEYLDHHQNLCTFLTLNNDLKEIIISVDGQINTIESNGILGNDKPKTKPWMYKMYTPITKPGNHIKSFCKKWLDLSYSELDICHFVAYDIRKFVKFRKGSTSAYTSAEDSFKKKRGVCQDFTHIFISCLRFLGFSVRYVSGYLKIEGVNEQDATHAWADVFIKDLGWVGFDVANGISPDERYVVLANGFDFFDASPIHGLHLDSQNTSLDVSVCVEQ